jgi:hypothetical protein
VREQRPVLSVLSPWMWYRVFWGWPVILTLPSSQYTHNAPSRLQIEPLQSVAVSGAEGSSMQTTPQ